MSPLARLAFGPTSRGCRSAISPRTQRGGLPGGPPPRDRLPGRSRPARLAREQGLKSSRETAERPASACGGPDLLLIRSCRTRGVFGVTFIPVLWSPAGASAGVPGPRRNADECDAGWFAPVATRRRSISGDPRPGPALSRRRWSPPAPRRRCVRAVRDAPGHPSESKPGLVQTALLQPSPAPARIWMSAGSRLVSLATYRLSYTGTPPQ